MIYRWLSPAALPESEALCCIFYSDGCEGFKALYTLRVSKEDYNTQKQHSDQINYLPETISMAGIMQQTKHFLITHVHPMRTGQWKERARESCGIIKTEFFLWQASLGQWPQLIPKQPCKGLWVFWRIFHLSWWHWKQCTDHGHFKTLKPLGMVRSDENVV